MARLPKPELLGVVEQSILDAGWRYLCLTPATEHPARYSLFRDGPSSIVRVYIWNLTPGGKNRPLDEWRIQVTGVSHFEPETEGKTRRALRTAPPRLR